jgi:hypothetical protein
MGGGVEGLIEDGERDGHALDGIAVGVTHGDGDADAVADDGGGGGEGEFAVAGRRG